MSKKRRQIRQAVQQQELVKTSWRKELLNYTLAFGLGAAIATMVTIMAMPNKSASAYSPITSKPLEYSKPPIPATIDPSLIDPDTMTVRKWRKVASLDELLKLSPEELDKVDIAEMNLLCATGLPGAEKINIPKILTSLDAFAASVRYQTKRHLYRVNDPKHAEHYMHSENILRAEFLLQVLQQDCGIHYNLQRVRDLDFTNSQDLFIHGLVGSNGGTCTSMPVLYVAVARRLDYPMSLALAPGHILARWDAPAGSDDPMKHFNVEGSGYGFAPYDDEHYRNWPRKMTKKETDSGCYLRPLSGAEMLSTFLTTRGHCLLDIGRFKEAREAYETAQRFSLKDPYLASFIRQADSRVAARRLAKANPGTSASAKPVAVRGRRQRYPDPLAELQRIEAMNANSRRMMMQQMRPPTHQPTYGSQIPQPGAANPYQPQQPYQPPASGQPRR